MKKQSILMLLVILCLSLALGACGNTKDTKKESAKEKKSSELITPDKKKTYSLDQTIDFKGLHVTLVKASLVQDDKGKKDSVLKVDMKVKNNSSSKRTFTSIGMQIEDKDSKKLSIYPGENIGEIIAPEKTVTGSAYFQVNGKAPYKIQYKDQDSDVTASWTIKDFSK
ncbi:DUF4352 domain-containing protein [Listeria sp. PSOL-1]|uniref:DUF4352 domain-containing protein n=1 Tax=Listeria sp. PSOL-1 TaxID=1844999 RepID=UPI0013D6B1A7|nr:DUF4352 domain-containing protein [Listeria sp. PSOL-1]